jgi:heat shock protein HslJ
MKKLFLIITILFAAIGSGFAQDKTLDGKWIFVSSSEKDLGEIAPDLLPELNFNWADKKVTGTTGCNTLSGKFETEKDKMTFGPVITTKKACTDMKVETYITKFLTDAGSYKIDSTKLFLYNKADKEKYVVFRRSTTDKAL